MQDRVGIGWRPELAAGIFASLDRIDVVEVIADDLFDAPSRALRAIRTLAAQVPVVLHGVSLGLASVSPVEPSRLDRLARVVGAIEPEIWSEHLAFVRADGVEIGHLAAPPRTGATLEGAARNIERAANVVGTKPLVENVATLIDPPGSTIAEVDWIRGAALGAGAGLLLDLNNLHANATNFGWNAVDALDEFPLDRVRVVHLAGGKWIASRTGERRLLDDHLHDVSDAVYALLTELGARASQPLTVVLERDGAYPPFEALLAELDRARGALRAGRARPLSPPVLPRPSFDVPAGTPDRARAFEAYVALLYVDAAERRRFLADPGTAAERAGLEPIARSALARIDRVGLELAAESFARKRAPACPRTAGR